MGVRQLLFASVLISGACLTAAFALYNLWGWVTGMAVLTGLWLVGLGRRSGWMAAAGAWGLLIGIAVAAGSNVSFMLVLLASLAFLAAWDLTRLADRMQLVNDGETANTYARSHLAVLAAVLGAGMLVGIIVMNIELDLTFAWIAGLTVLVLILIRIATGLLQRWE